MRTEKTPPAQRAVTPLLGLCLTLWISACSNTADDPTVRGEDTATVEGDKVPAQAAAGNVDSTAAADTDSASGSTTGVAYCTSSTGILRERLLELVNDVRASSRYCGDYRYEAAGALSWSEQLLSAASGHSSDMANHNFFSHSGSDGSSVADRVSATGYDWRTVGENIAAGQLTAERTVDDWLGSPGHCGNLMNPNYAEFAVACVEDEASDYTRYWTQVLAAQR